MSIKSFNPNAAQSQKWISAAGNYEVTVRGFEAKYTKNADYYAKFTFVTAEGEATSGVIYAKADRNGNHIGLESFMAATATEDEVTEYVGAGEINVDEAFLEKVATRSKGRGLVVKVTEREYEKDGQKKKVYEATYFNRLPSGPGPF
jgi:hypothetical protein